MYNISGLSTTTHQLIKTISRQFQDAILTWARFGKAVDAKTAAEAVGRPAGRLSSPVFPSRLEGAAYSTFSLPQVEWVGPKTRRPAFASRVDIVSLRWKSQMLFYKLTI
jgi:hypothetical protein